MVHVRLTSSKISPKGLKHICINQIIKHEFLILFIKTQMGDMPNRCNLFMPLL